jgi:hypothetical protein
MQTTSSIVMAPRERGLIVLLQATAIVAAACCVAACASGFAMYLAAALPDTLFHWLQSWIPRNYWAGMSRNDLGSGSRGYITWRPFPWQDIWEHAQPLIVLTFIMQLLSIGLASLAWPVSWRGVDAWRRRALLAQAWWLSSLGLIVIVPVVELTWIVFLRTAGASGNHWDLALDTSDHMVIDLSIPAFVFLFTVYVLRRVVRCTAPHSNGRCKHCDYQLTASASAVCPECGPEVADPFTVSAAWLRIFTARGGSRWMELLWIVPLLLLASPLVMPQLQVLCRIASRLF